MAASDAGRAAAALQQRRAPRCAGVQRLTRRVAAGVGSERQGAATSSMSATLHHHVCCCSVQSHATSAAPPSATAATGAGAGDADASVPATSTGASVTPGRRGTHKLVSGPCRSCKRPRQETSRERQRGQRSSPLLTPCSSTSRPPRGGRSDAAYSACMLGVGRVRRGCKTRGHYKLNQRRHELTLPKLPERRRWLGGRAPCPKRRRLGNLFRVPPHIAVSTRLPPQCSR